MTREEYLKREIERILPLFTQHELLGDEAYWDGGSGARWCIGRPNSNMLRMEVIAGTIGSLVVHGDFDLVRFACYGDRSDAWSRLRWLGSRGSDYDYVYEKAQIGTGHQFSRAYDSTVARADIESELADLELDGEPAALIDVLRSALPWVDEQHELRQYLADHDEGWDLWERSYGEVIPPSVITGVLTLQTCTRLLLARYGDEGPPACRKG